MATFTRRTFFRRASLATVAVGALAAAPRLMEAPGQRAEAAEPSAARSTAVATATTSVRASTDPLVAYVRDAAKGEVVLMAGAREIVRYDPELVSRLLQFSV